eukprot:TRINITY_DN425_c1_g1_i12.p1 TRINITY_DN425_c1_g1~~TRINITY_DN425_c1_g1_i12.p1  ORF type:complete len:149 (+),score=27.45 TRINITY_DN425_c1_g1_i12:55-501(+)
MSKMTYFRRTILLQQIIQATRVGDFGEGATRHLFEAWQQWQKDFKDEFLEMGDEEITEDISEMEKNIGQQQQYSESENNTSQEDDILEKYTQKQKNQIKKKVDKNKSKTKVDSSSKGAAYTFEAVMSQKKRSYARSDEEKGRGKKPRA